jgi:alanyl-tRNA synthetase
VGQVEERSNQIVTENRPVQVDFEDAMAAKGLRKPSEREGTLRVVTILDLDRSACGGTHVRATGEIGSIAIRKVERMRSGMRLEFVCGGRAVRFARADHQLLSRLSGELTAAPTDLPEVIKRTRVELKETRAAQQELQKELDSYRARELYAGTVPSQDGVRRILYQDPSGSMDRLRGLALAVATMSKVLFVGSAGQLPALIVATSRDSELDAAQLMKVHLADFGGRGGGSARLAQGVLPEPDQLETLIGLVMAPRVSR